MLQFLSLGPGIQPRRVFQMPMALSREVHAAREITQTRIAQKLENAHVEGFVIMPVRDNVFGVYSEEVFARAITTKQLQNI